MSTDQERIAKRLARAGVASRREAERMIEAGRVTVNGIRLDSPALNVGPGDRIEVDGKPLAAKQPVRMWRYHKPAGLVTTNADEKGRRTIFDALPAELPRVMTVGRLDLNSEGLLLLTNDGDLKRRLELPSTGWMRKYRVRVNGSPEDRLLEPLRKGLTVDGERFQPMTVSIDSQKGANAWLTIGLREGKNREIRRALEQVGLLVNRLIRVSYGPFQIGDLVRGGVEEIRPKILRDQLGIVRDTSDTPGSTIQGETPDTAAKGAARSRVVRRGGAADPARRMGPGRAGASALSTAPPKPAPSKPTLSKSGQSKSGPSKSAPSKPGPSRSTSAKATSGRPAPDRGPTGKAAAGKPAQGKPDPNSRNSSAPRSGSKQGGGKRPPSPGRNPR